MPRRPTVCQAIRSELMPRTPSSIDLLQTLVAFDTTSAVSNLELITFVEHYLAQFNVESSLIYDEGGAKANLYATIGPADKPGIMLSGHTDVVPTTGQQWQGDPYTLRQHDGLLYGRGACDMKGFIACVLAAVPDLQRRTLDTPVHIALSYDEEVGCLGVRRMIDMMATLPIQPAMAIIGEPTSMQAMIGHKGKCSQRVTVSGTAGHSAYATESINAIQYAAELINEIYRIQQHIAENGPFDSDYRVPYTTLHVGVIEGGTALNMMPLSCCFNYEIRHLPEQDPFQLVDQIQEYAEHAVLPRMRRLAEHVAIRQEPLISYPGLQTDAESQAVSLVKQWLAQDMKVSKVSFGTEAGLFTSSLGIPAVVCGPGSIQQAHRADEYVSVTQLEHCDAMLERLGRSIST